MDLDWKDKFKDCYSKIKTIGEAYAEARGQSYQMQELKGSILASIINKLPDMPVSRAELSAKSSPDYIAHIKETAESIKKELRLKAQYEAEKARFEAYRSLSSLEKATRNLSE